MGNMDAIRKKMQSMKVEIDDMYNKCKEYEDATKEANNASDKNDIDIRDVGKKVQKMETKMEEILEQLQASNSKMEQLDAESKDADNIVKGCRHWESKTMNNEVEIEELDKNMREAKRIGADNEMKYDNLARSLAMMEDELKRAG